MNTPDFEEKIKIFDARMGAYSQDEASSDEDIKYVRRKAHKRKFKIPTLKEMDDGGVVTETLSVKHVRFEDEETITNPKVLQDMWQEETIAREQKRLQNEGESQPFSTQDWTDGQVIEDDDDDAIIANMNEHTSEEKVDVDVGVVRKYKFYGTETNAKVTKTALGYVYNAKHHEGVVKLLKDVRGGKHKNVVWYALAKHFDSPCAGLFEEKTDHYHLIVWFVECKPQDLAFHRTFYKWPSGKDWKSEKVRSERGLLQYIQCEPRELIEAYASKDHAQFIQHCYDTREEMQKKIETRDTRKAAARPMKVNYVGENDWWQENDMNPQAIVTACIENGIRDVNKFLLWLSEFHPDKTIGSFTFNRDKQRLEKEINMTIRRYWYTKNWHQHLEGLRMQIEGRVGEERMLSINDTINALEDIIKRNGYDFPQFVVDVLDTIYMRRAKRNTLYLQGPSNSCKSTIAWSILNGSPNVGQGMASQDFMYHNCVNTSFIWFEELKVTPDVINELKRILEGSETCTNRKNQDGFYLPRTPVISSTIPAVWRRK